MKPKERVISTINLKRTDRIPFTLMYSLTVTERLCRKLNVRNTLELNLKFGVDLFGLQPGIDAVSYTHLTLPTNQTV